MKNLIKGNIKKIQESVKKLGLQTFMFYLTGVQKLFRIVTMGRKKQTKKFLI